jgi:hypothetical protein
VLLQYCYSVVTVLSQCCYSAVSVLSQCCHSVVTVLPQCCHTGLRAHWDDGLCYHDLRYIPALSHNPFVSLTGTLTTLLYTVTTLYYYPQAQTIWSTHLHNYCVTALWQYCNNTITHGNNSSTVHRQQLLEAPHIRWQAPAPHGRNQDQGQFCYSIVTVVFRNCYSVVTLLSQHCTLLLPHLRWQAPAPHSGN